MIDNLMVGIYKNFSSVYRHTSLDSKAGRELNLEGVLTLKEYVEVCSTNLELKNLQDTLQSKETKDEKDDFKKKHFPAITPVGVLSKRSKNINNLMYPTRLIFGDIDKLENLSLDTIKEVLVNDPHIMFVKLSSSGKGFHFMFRIDGGVEYYESALLSKYEELNNKLNIKNNLDTNVKDWSRLQAVSYDPDLYYSKDKEIYNVKNLKVSSLKPTVEVEITQEDKEFIKDLDLKNINQDRHLEFIKALKNKNLCWDSGNRNTFIGNVPTLSKEGFSLEEILIYSIKFINGDYTQDYTEKRILRDILKLYKKYNLKNEEITDFGCDFLLNTTQEGSQEKKEVEVSMQLTDTFFFNQYITDIEDVENIVFKKLVREEHLLINAPTGAGKTTFIYSLIEKCNLKCDFIFPSKLLTMQQKSSGAEVVVGTDKLYKKEATVVAATWDNLNKIYNRGADLLVIDEAHLLITDYTFRNDAIQAIKRFLKNYKYVIYLTGTPQPFQSFFKNKSINFENRTENNKYYDIIKRGKREYEEQKIVLEKYMTGALNIYYKNNKKTLQNLKEVVETKGYEVGLLTSEEKDSQLYEDVITQQKLLNCKWLFTTCVIREGINILNDFENVNIVFGSDTDLISIQQFAARFRKAKNVYLNIIHSGEVKALKHFSKQSTKDTIDELFKLRNQVIGKEFEKDYFSNTQKGLLSKLFKYSFLDSTNQVDWFFVLNYSNFLENKNNSSNINYLKGNLNKFFKEVTVLREPKISIDKGVIKQINKTRNEKDKDKRIKYTEQLISTGNPEYDCKWKEDINSNYNKFLEIFSKEELYKITNDFSQGFKLTSGDVMSKINTRKWIGAYHYFNNKEAIQAGDFVNDKEGNFADTKLIMDVENNILTGHYLKKEGCICLTLSQLEEIFKTFKCYGKKPSDLFGLEYTYKAIKIKVKGTDKVVKHYCFEEANRSKYHFLRIALFKN